MKFSIKQILMGKSFFASEHYQEYQIFVFVISNGFMVLLIQ